jgi:UDP-N-acetylglucosamine:LPS N-acetylglucosamine transferase
VHDEAYEVSIALRENPQLIKAPVVGILDFIGDFRMSWSPLEWVLVRYLNGLWAKEPGESLTLIIGELADLPDAKLGFGRPSLRDVAQRKGTHNVGYVLDFDPRDYADRAQLRIKLGYGEDPLVICCIGGTAVGKELLELCGRACPSAREKLPKLRMKLVCGPRLSPNSLDVPPGVEVVGYVPALHEHLAAADLVVTAAGGMTTLELTALRRPFLYFPIQQHFEQQVHVAHRLQRHGAGVKMDFSKTSPELLAEHIVTNIAKPVTWPPIRVDGMERAAELISSQLRTIAVP